MSGSDWLSESTYYAKCAGLDPSQINGTFYNWLNISANYTIDQMGAYVSSYYYYFCLNTGINYSLGGIGVVISIIGLIGYIVELAVLQLPEFKTASFMYHRALAVLE